MVNGVKEVLDDFVSRMETLKERDVNVIRVSPNHNSFVSNAGTFVTSKDGLIRQVVNQSRPDNTMKTNASSSGVRSCSDEIFGGEKIGSQHGTFASVLQTKSNKRVVKIKELRNEEVVEGAAVAIPFEAVEEVKSRFSNTLYGFFIGKRLAFPLVENYVKNTWAKYGLRRTQLHDDFFLFQFETKEGMDRVLEDGPWLIRTVPLILNVWSPNTDLKKAEVRKAPVWIKLHHVPIVAYSEIGLSLITTQLGKPITLDSYTSTMCLSSWGKSTYARALIEVSAEKELVESLVIAIPVDKENVITLATINIEYEWNPPRCSTCMIFDHHSDKCPKLPKVAPAEKVDEEGFVEVKKKKHKNKNRQTKIAGVRLSKPQPQFRRVDKGEPSKQALKDTSKTPEISVSNSYGPLNNEDDNDTYVDSLLKQDDVLNFSDDDLDEELQVGRDGKITSNVPGASTPVNEVTND
ncbi:zinc knuckle CX2CX4HX4C containing protein [Tanacetum coccineum]